MFYYIQFVTHSVLAECLQTASIVGEKLLKAYATQKISEETKELYECIGISEYMVKTHRHLCNRKIISYKAELRPNPNIPISLDDKENLSTEREYRRTIESSHSYLSRVFNNSCNDFSDMKYICRELEIVFMNYRLVINPKEEVYSIQYKERKMANLAFLQETMTLEGKYESLEGNIHVDPSVVKTINENDDSEYFIGVASFLDCKDLSVKTTYLKYTNLVTLYQRVGVDDYSKSYPFILELEENDDACEGEKQLALQLYLETAWRLDAKLPNFISENYLVLPSKYKPIYSNQKRKVEAVISLPKLDGYPATLRFYETHFVVSNSMTSYSISHNFSQRDYYVIKDYKFLVESELYDCSRAPNAMAIIDIQTGDAFTAKTRYEIIQLLKDKYQDLFSKYNIFFNSEKYTLSLSVNGIKRKKTDNLELKDGHIYEVLLNKNHQVIDIIRERKDKLRPNSGKLVRAIVKK